MFDTELEFDEFEFELDSEYEFDEYEGGLTEEQELDLAAELLEITDEAELEEFLGKLIKTATRGVKRFANSAAGKALGGVLKKVAKTALPVAGGALGNLVAPGVGGAIGSKLGSMATKLFELEYEAEMMDEEELEMEVARRFVRLAASSAQKAAAAPSTANPRTVAKGAVMSVAKRQAPPVAKLVARIPTTSIQSARRRTQTGRWTRRGSTIVIHGV